MGEHEAQDQIQKEMDNDITDRRDTAQKTTSLPPERALKNIIEKLSIGNGYYSWTSFGEPPAWQLRVPLLKEDSEAWMKDEGVELIHVCSPALFYAAVLKEDKEALVNHSGYYQKGECARCKTPAPKKLIKTYKTQSSLFKVAKAVK